MVVESIMGRSLHFFDSIEDATLISLLLKRLHKSRGNLDVDELFEKAEVRLLQLFGYDAAYSEERMIRNMTNCEVDCESMADIAEMFMLAKSGGPVFKCIALYATRQVEINSAYLKLLFCLDMVGVDVSNMLEKNSKRIELLMENTSIID